MDKKNQILKTAQHLFAQFGLKKVTTDDIAHAGHISKATIYKYFGNKTEIFDAVIRMEAEELLFSIREAVASEPKVIDKFRAYLLTRIAKLEELINFHRVTERTWSDFWPHLAEIGRWFIEEEEKIVTDIMVLGNTTGELEIKRFDLAAHVTVVALRSIEFPWALNAHKLTAAEYVDIMLDMIIHGIGTEKKLESRYV